MEHYALHARRGLWLFHDWEEARALWDRLVAVTAVHHLCLMPDHVHLLARSVSRQRLAGAMSGYARWLGHRWGWQGFRLWRALGQPAVIGNPEHLQRTRRYVLLNPCRGSLVDDPLAWPFSTHRDATGLAWPPARRLVSEPFDFHAHVSKDDSTAPRGTDLPVQGLVGRHPAPDEVLNAVSAVTRTPSARFQCKGVARRQLILCLRGLTDLSARGIARQLGMSHSSVAAVRHNDEPVLRIVERVVGDPRFAPLEPTDLRNTLMWQRYRAYLAAKRGARARRSGF